MKTFNDLHAILGPILLRGGLGGAGGAAGGTTTTSSLDDDFSDEEDDNTSDGAGSTSSGGRKVNVSLPTFAPFEDSEEDTDSKTASSSITSDSPSKINLLSNTDSFGSETRTSSVSDKNEFNVVR